MSRGHFFNLVLAVLPTKPAVLVLPQSSPTPVDLVAAPPPPPPCFPPASPHRRLVPLPSDRRLVPLRPPPAKVQFRRPPSAVLALLPPALVVNHLLSVDHEDRPSMDAVDPSTGKHGCPFSNPQTVPSTSGAPSDGAVLPRGWRAGAGTALRRPPPRRMAASPPSSHHHCPPGRQPHPVLQSEGEIQCTLRTASKCRAFWDTHSGNSRSFENQIVLFAISWAFTKTSITRIPMRNSA
ncbi:U1 small nuclear ribonucleoprotein C isoform X1 [Triticum aestivum]|uniref:U1 small nuclear ribonucleoprotein C isoform X1 n=1 Tax=Triticum aestivum TaxID=4565 RepID=UPI001D010F9D|nr:U1 small nuclear ribonucleoprotein C-like isoform X1 [Triticum aestivum]